MNIGFGDTIRLPSGDTGTVRFIGHTEFKKNVIFYGIHLKEEIGKNNGSYDKRKYFKCPHNHGVFTVRKNLERVKKHSVSASFYYDQNVLITNNIGKGSVKYIGLTKYDNYKNYLYGILLESNIKPIKMKEIKNNEHIFYNVTEKNKYFNGNAKKIIFVRQNQLKYIKKTKNNKIEKPINRMRRAKTMIPQKKIKKQTNNKNKNKIKKQTTKTIKSSKQLKSKRKLNNENNENEENIKIIKINKKNKKKNKKEKSKKEKIKKIREMRMTKSDISEIRENHKPKQIEIKHSKTNGNRYNGCPTPSTISINENKKKKRKIAKMKTKTKTKTKMRMKMKIKKIKNRKNSLDQYYEIINNYQEYEKYIDSKHYYYHKQFIKQRDDINNSDDIKQRDGPPSMVSFFSTRSRINQKKKRQLPITPKIYTITIITRPLGFFIETKQLNTITENENGEHIVKQVELVDNQNKFNKVNAYISMIGNIELWGNTLIIGSQLLSINEVDITGFAFTNIFKILSSEKVPFEIKLAAPTETFENNNDNNDNKHSLLQSPRLAPESQYIIDGPRGRGQTIDETQFSKRKKFLLF